MASCVEGSDDVVVEDSVDSDGTASPFWTSRLGHVAEKDKLASQTSAGLKKPAMPAEDSENSKLLCTGEEHMFSSSDEEDSEQSQLLLPQSLQISPYLSHLKPPGDNSPVFPPHLPHLKPQSENSPVFPPPAKIRKLSGETRTKEHSVENVDNDSDVTQLSDNIEQQPELDLGHTTHDLARKEPDGGEEKEGCHGDQSRKCSLEAQQPKLEGDKVTAAVQDSAVRGTTAIEETRLTKKVKTHPDGDLKKEGISKEGGTEKSVSFVQKDKGVTGTEDVSEGSGEVCRERSSEEGSSSLGSLQESVVAVSDVGADKTMCQQHDEEMQLLGRLEGRQEKLNPLLSTTDRTTALKVRRELSCIQTLIATLIQAHQRQRTAISALSTEQMQEQMRLFVQRHKRLVQIFSVQKTATAKFKGRMKVTATQSTKVTGKKLGGDSANQSLLTSQTSSDKINEREMLVGRKCIGGKKGRNSAASSSKTGSSEMSSVKSQELSEKQTMTSLNGVTAQKLPLLTSSKTAREPLTESSDKSTTAMHILQTLDGSSQLKAVLKAGSLQKGQIVEVVSKDGKQSVQYRVVGMESVGGESQPQTSVSMPASTKSQVAANSGKTIQHGNENVASCVSTVVSSVKHTVATTLPPASSKLAELSQQADVTTDNSQALLKTQAWNPPFKPSNGDSSVALEKTQGVSEVAETSQGFSNGSGRVQALPVSKESFLPTKVQNLSTSLQSCGVIQRMSVPHCKSTVTMVSAPNSSMQQGLSINPTQSLKTSNLRKTQEEKQNSAKTTKADVSVKSRAEVLWQQIVPQVQKQSVTSAKTGASEALKECLVGNKGASSKGLSTSIGTGVQVTPQGAPSIGGTGGQVQGLSTTGGAGVQVTSQGWSTAVGARGQFQGPSNIGLVGAQHTQGLSTVATMEGQTQGIEVPTVLELLRAQLIQPGKDVLSCKGKAGLQFASLLADGTVMTQGGLTFSKVAQWHRAIWGHRTGQKRAMVFRQVCYRGTPLAEVSAVVTPAGQTTSPVPVHLQHIQGTGVAPTGQTIPPVTTPVPVQLNHTQGTGVKPVHLQSTSGSAPEDVEMIEEQQVSLPCSGSASSPGIPAPQDAAQDNKVLKPTSILLITDEELFVSRLLLPEKFWESAGVKLNQFLEAAVSFK